MGRGINKTECLIFLEYILSNLVNFSYKNGLLEIALSFFFFELERHDGKFRHTPSNKPMTQTELGK